MANRNINGDVNVEFNEASSRQGLDSGESVKTLFGKVRKWLSDLKPVAFSGSYNDLTNKPTIPPAVAVKGDAENTYRTGNVNLTPANIGAATSAQGTKADSAVQTIQIGGTTQTKTDGVVDLPAYPTKSLLGLDNVNNTSDLDKPISTAAQAALDSQQEQINYNANNGVKNLISTKWFIKDNNSTIESRNDKTGSLTSSAPASASAAYIQTYIPEDIVNPILENGKTYILSWNVDSRTNNGIFGIRKATGVYHSSSTLNRTGSYSVSYTHDSSVPVFISLCINTSATSAVKRIALSNIMLREATVEDSTFQPYAKSNAELTQDLNEISEELDCLVIRAALVNNEVRIQNTSDFTDELYRKYASHTKPKFAILKLQITSSTYYYKALINSSSVSQATVMEASFITVNGEYMSIYKFNWSLSGTVGTPTVSYTSLNLGS